MKGKFLLTASLVSLSLCSAAQNARTYAITGKSNNNFLWSNGTSGKMPRAWIDLPDGV